MSGETQEDNEKLHSGHCPSRASNQALPEYESKALLLSSVSSAKVRYFNAEWKYLPFLFLANRRSFQKRFFHYKKNLFRHLAYYRASLKETQGKKFPFRGEIPPPPLLQTHAPSQDSDACLTSQADP
jgi:hypothetical protein